MGPVEVSGYDLTFSQPDSFQLLLAPNEPTSNYKIDRWVQTAQVFWDGCLDR